MTQANEHLQVKSSHLYLYSAFNNTNCNKALHNIKIGKFCQCKMTGFNTQTLASASIKGHLWNTSSSFFQGGPTGMPEAWPRDVASRSHSQGTMVTYVT